MKHYTGVGSRNTPEDVQQLMEAVADKLAREGYILRSGGADGADLGFQRGANKPFQRGQDISTHPPIVYLPWKSFNLQIQKNVLGQYVVVSEHPLRDRARQMVSEVHPAWEKCSQGAKALHTRNAYQALGDNLNNPSSFCLLWAEPTLGGEAVKGGTNMAFQLCRNHGVPTYNLYFKEVRERLERWLAK